jgi:hypothetical protein
VGGAQPAESKGAWRSGNKTSVALGTEAPPICDGLGGEFAGFQKGNGRIQRAQVKGTEGINRCERKEFSFVSDLLHANKASRSSR